MKTWLVGCFSCLVACGGVSSVRTTECEGGAWTQPDAAARDAEASAVDAAPPAPTGTVTLVDRTTVTSLQRTFQVPLPKARAVGDLLLAVWRGPGEPTLTSELDEWSLVTQTQVGAPGTEQFLWVATRRITAPPQATDPDATFHSEDGYQEMTFLLYRGARAVEPLTPIRTVTTRRAEVRAPFVTEEGRPSRAIYLVTAPAAGAWGVVPAEYRKVSESAEVLAFDSLQMLAAGTREAPLLRLRPTPEVVTALAAAIVAE